MQRNILCDMFLICMLLTLYISYTARFWACHVTAVTNHYTASIWWISSTGMLHNCFSFKYWSVL